MDEKATAPEEVQMEGKVSAIVIIDEEEKIILRKIDLQQVPRCYIENCPED